MTKKSILVKGMVSFFLFVFIISKIAILPGCAVQSPPLGGPRDSLPPVLLAAKPADSSRNNTPKRIVLEFNEFVQLDNPSENVLFSPTPKNNPTIEAKLKTVTITIRDTLEANTTYTIDFGNALKDINESNIAKNLSYVFSTGTNIDSLQLSGKVIIAQTGKPDTTLIAALYKNLDDSAVAKEKPRYIAHLNGKGSFTFRNLPPGTYALYAFKDEGGTKRYLSKSQLFAFLDNPVTPGDSTVPVTLYAYFEKEEKPLTTTTTRPTGKRPIQDNKLRIEPNLENNELDLLGNLEIYFRSAPLKTLDTSKIIFLDSKGDSITNYHIIRDTGNTKISLIYQWTPNTQYSIILDKEFATDTGGRKLLKNDTILFHTKKEADYGSVRLRFLTLDLGKNPVLQFVQSDEVKYSHVFTSKEFYTKLFLPGEYDLRILYDDNKNGRWDPGEFFGRHRQPEIVVPISRKLTVKANWDNDVDINL